MATKEIQSDWAKAVAKSKKAAPSRDGSKAKKAAKPTEG